ncbi:MAG: lysophospholipid acyltransferase family protein [Verrucomicrobiota bacterium]
MAERNRVKQLSWGQRRCLELLSLLMRVWSWTLRFELDATLRSLKEASPGPIVVILWHNRLFAAPELYRRHFKWRRLAGLVSASGDGAWLSAFMETLGIEPVRGSRHKRGAQAFRELLKVSRAGFDVVITPDGSRGPVYEMKPGALSVAVKTEAPMLLLSLNFGGAWRLKSWDRFYLPFPFSKVEARAELVAVSELAETSQPEALVANLEQKLSRITVDRS